MNNIIDPIWEWPLTTTLFRKFLENKYGSVAIAKTTVHHYEYIWSERVEVTGTADPIPEQFVEVDYATYLTINEDLKRITNPGKRSVSEILCLKLGRNLIINFKEFKNISQLTDMAQNIFDEEIS